MCELATISAAGALIGAGISAYGQAKAGEAQDQVARNNAMVAGWQRSDAIQRGQMEADAIRMEARTINAGAEAALGANNIESTTGSSANLFAVSSANAERDAALTRANAARRAWGLTNEAQDTVAQGRIAKRAGYLNALGTGLGGIGQAAGAYANR